MTICQVSKLHGLRVHLAKKIQIWLQHPREKIDFEVWWSKHHFLGHLLANLALFLSFHVFWALWNLFFRWNLGKILSLSQVWTYLPLDKFFPLVSTLKVFLMLQIVSHFYSSMPKKPDDLGISRKKESKKYLVFWPFHRALRQTGC